MNAEITASSSLDSALPGATVAEHFPLRRSFTAAIGFLVPVVAAHSFRLAGEKRMYVIERPSIGPISPGSLPLRETNRSCHHQGWGSIQLYDYK
jgi:hypothetical protein